MSDYDAIVIGSGAGGMTTSLCLAQAGLKVVMVEQHYVAGGWCHSFNLEGYHFSPGIHYIGELGPGQEMREIYEGLGVANDMEFFELNPDGYEHIVCGQEQFDIPKNPKNFETRLVERFPSEKEGIETFMKMFLQLSNEVAGFRHCKHLGDMAKNVVKSPNVVRYGLLPFKKVVASFVKDPFLQTILEAQAGDHGLPPSMAPTVLQAALATHYWNGAWFPKGGGGAIPKAFIRAFKKVGGKVMLSTEVDEILTERSLLGHRAVGVRLRGGDEIRAKYVVSNADPKIMYGRLLNQNILSAGLRRKLHKTKYSIAASSLFMAVDMDLRALGLDSGNYWWFKNPDVDSVYAPHHSFRDLKGSFMNITSHKDPTKANNGHQTIEAFSILPYELFAAWKDTEFEKRPEDYTFAKKAIQEGLLETIRTMVPGIDDHIVFSDVATPLTNEHYIRTGYGSMYGTEKNLKQLLFPYPVKTEIKNLYHCGASTLGHGVAGATMSGLAAAGAILKCSKDDLLSAKGQTLRCYSAEDETTWPKNVVEKVNQKRRQATKKKEAI